MSGRQMWSSSLYCAYVHAEEAGQTADTFDWQLEHRETGTDHVRCPGQFIIDNIDAMQARTKAVMNWFQWGIPMTEPIVVTYPPGWSGAPYPVDRIVVPPTPKPLIYAPLNVPVWLNGETIATGKNQTINGATIYACHRRWTARVDTRRRQYADLRSASVGEDIKMGSGFMGEYLIHSKDGHWYVLTHIGTRVLMDDLTEAIVFTAR